MASQKSPWARPQLIVLTRGTPDESVLFHCKRIEKIGDLGGAEVLARAGAGHVPAALVNGILIFNLDILSPLLMNLPARQNDR